MDFPFFTAALNLTFCAAVSSSSSSKRFVVADMSVSSSLSVFDDFGGMMRLFVVGSEYVVRCESNKTRYK